MVHSTNTLSIYTTFLNPTRTNLDAHPRICQLYPYSPPSHNFHECLYCINFLLYLHPPYIPILLHSHTASSCCSLYHLVFIPYECDYYNTRNIIMHQYSAYQCLLSESTNSPRMTDFTGDNRVSTDILDNIPVLHSPVLQDDDPLS